MIYRFDDIAYNITTKRVPTPDDNARYIGLEHLDPGELYVKRYGSNVDLKGDKLVMTKGDILFGKRNTYLKRVAIAPFDGLFSAHGMIFHPKEDVIDKRYFPFFINSDAFMDEAIRISVGSLSPTVNWKDLKDLKFDIPPIEEQKQIADKLWIAYDLKSKYANLVESIDEMVKSQFIEMFGSRDFLKRLGDYVSVKTGKLDANASVEGGRYPFFTCAEKTLSIDTYAFDCNAVLLAGNGEFCVKHYDGKFNAYQRTYVIESKDESILSTKYLYAWLKDYANILKANAIGGVIKYIKLGDIINAQINLPSQDRQLEYVKIYEQADKSKQIAFSRAS